MRPSTPARTPEEWAGAYAAHGLAAGRGPSWARNTRRFLGRFLLWLKTRGHEELNTATEGRLLDYLAAESKRTSGHRDRHTLAPATLGAELGVLRGFFKFLVKQKAILYNPAQGVSLGKHARGARRVPGREEVNRLLAAGGSRRFGLRDRAIAEVLYSTGIRSQELCNLDLQDADLAGGVVAVRKGKGGKDRLVPIGKTALRALGEYLRCGRPGLRPSTPALFVNRSGRRLNTFDVRNLVKSRSLQAGLENPMSPHLLRHAFATHLLENGASIRHVQAMLGHASIDSTQIYTHVDRRRLSETVDRLDVRASLERGLEKEPVPGLGRFSF